MKVHKIVRRTWIVLVLFSLESCTSEEKNNSNGNVIHRKHNVHIQQMKFTPAEVIVNLGDTVTWTNHDIVDHNVTEESNERWNSPTLSINQSWSLVVRDSANYYCSLHKVMKGKLILKK